jgi:hypothetical protein
MPVNAEKFKAGVADAVAEIGAAVTGTPEYVAARANAGIPDGDIDTPHLPWEVARDPLQQRFTASRVRTEGFDGWEMTATMGNVPGTETLLIGTQADGNGAAHFFHSNGRGGDAISRSGADALPFASRLARRVQHVERRAMPAMPAGKR